jgi:hypothetical protein
VTFAPRYCDALCATRMTQFLYMLSCSFMLGVAAAERNCARASCTSWCGDTRGLCAQFGWVTNVIDYRSSGAALCCVWIPSIGVHIRRQLLLLTRWLLPNLCMGWCNTSGKVHSSFEIHSAWSVCTVVCTLLCEDSH